MAYPEIAANPKLEAPPKLAAPKLVAPPKPMLLYSALLSQPNIAPLTLAENSLYILIIPP